jgi:hypothetical protein
MIQQHHIQPHASKQHQFYSRFGGKVPSFFRRETEPRDVAVLTPLIIASTKSHFS